MLSKEKNPYLDPDFIASIGAAQTPYPHPEDVAIEQEVEQELHIKELERENKRQSSLLEHEFIREIPWAFRKACRSRFLQSKIDELEDALAESFRLLDAIPDQKIKEHMFRAYFDIPVKTEALRRYKLELDSLSNKGRIDDYDIALAQQTDIMSTNLVAAKPAGGGRYLALCLFHKDSHPSMVIYPGERGFHCFACHKSGTAIDIVMQVKKCHFVEAVKFLVGK